MVDDCKAASRSLESGSQKARQDSRNPGPAGARSQNAEAQASSVGGRDGAAEEGGRVVKEK